MSCLPNDVDDAVLVGRAWLPNEGPAVVSIRNGQVVDVTRYAPTVSGLFEVPEAARFLSELTGPCIGSVANLERNSWEPTRDPNLPWLLAPCDLQAVKAAGVTFAASLLERLIEEHSYGDASVANSLREQVLASIGAKLMTLRPGSEAVARLKKRLIARGMWSQYLEVGLGPEAEIFTKAQPMSAIGSGSVLGVHRASAWNNPEPEIVIVANSAGNIVGATLGNDVNLRDIEGRSALLLGRAKDNNGSCVIGPFIRLFSAGFEMAHIRNAVVTLHVEGTDGFQLDGVSSMREISRDPEELVQQVIGTHHQYPDGFVLFLGTMFAPVEDRAERGKGFTHRTGDVVKIECPLLGRLANQVGYSDEIRRWEFGTNALMRNLAKRGLLPQGASS